MILTPSSIGWRNVGVGMVALVIIAVLALPSAMAQDTALSGRAQQLDSNSNGQVDRDEARGPLAANFDDMDCNGNGGLDGAEIRGFFTGAGCPEKTAAAPASKFPPLSDRGKAADANKNGLIERNEAQGPLAANFDEIDCDKNGGLDGGEIPNFFQGKSCSTAAGADDDKKAATDAKPADTSGRPGGPGGPGGGRPPQAVQLDEVLLETTSETFTVVGRVIAPQRGDLSTEVGGAVAELKVDVGNRVKKGDVVAQLSTSRLEADRKRIAAQVSRHQSMVKNAERELRRMRNLSNSAAFSRARFEDLEGVVAERKAQAAEFGAALERLIIDIRDASIRAPYDAVVLSKHVEVGSFVNVGAPIVTLINDQALEVEVEIPSFRIGSLGPGSEAKIVVDGGTEYPAKIRSIIPNDNTRTRTRPARLVPEFGADAAKFANNQGLAVKFPLTTGNRILTVHKDAIVRRANGSVVFVVDGTNANMKTVQLGRAVGNKFEVLDGLNAGDKVVIRGNERLGAGGRVRILP